MSQKMQGQRRMLQLRRRTQLKIVWSLMSQPSKKSTLQWIKYVRI